MRHRTLWRSILAAAALCAACGESLAPPVPTTITLSPPSLTLELGESGAFTARIVDQYGNATSGSVSWSSSQRSVATVGPSGIVEGVGPGTALITASASAAQTSAEVTVLAPPFVLSTSGVNTRAYHSHAVSDRWECHYDFTMTATGGTPSDFARWTSGEVEWRFSAGGTFILPLSTTDMLDWFGSDRIVSGENQTLRRFAFSGSTFSSLGITLRATLPDGSQSSTFVFITCAGSAPRPRAAVTGISFSPTSPATLRLGEDVIVTINYTTEEADGVLIWARPYTAGQFTPGGAFEASGTMPMGAGSLTRSFTIREGFPATTVDQVQILVRDASNTVQVLETFFSVNYTYTATQSQESRSAQSDSSDECLVPRPSGTTLLVSSHDALLVGDEIDQTDQGVLRDASEQGQGVRKSQEDQESETQCPPRVAGS